MIEFDRVGLSFNGRRVLDDLSFGAELHERVAILGPSGEGKTTILKLILGLLRPDAGRILVDGTDITRLSERELRPVRANFGIVFQEGALFDSLTVRENVAFFLREDTRWPEERIEGRVRELLERMGLGDAMDRLPDELSGGMQRRVSIARSLAAAVPRMMLYDEPTTGLDPITADTISGLIRELSAGEPPGRMGFVLVTHKVADAAKVADRFLYLRHNIAFDGDVRALMAVGDPEIRRFVNELFIADVCAGGARP